MKLQAAVKKETFNVALGTTIATVFMLVVFAVLHKIMPESVPFGLREVISGLVGCAVAVLNFFIMAISVQKVANTEDQDTARRAFTVSYRYRTMLQLVWGIISLAVPALNGAAGIIPLFFPSGLIKARGIFTGKHDGKEKEVNV